MSNRYTKLILNHLANTRYKPKAAKQLAKSLKISKENFTKFQEEITGLLENEKININSSNEISLPPPAKQVVGLFRRHERGFGFIAPEKLSAYGDLFVPPGQTGSALTDDKVLAKVSYNGARAKGKNSDKSPYTASIIKVIQRAEKPFTGTLIKEKGKFKVDVDGKEFAEHVLIRDGDIKGAKAGQKVVIELVHYPRDSSDLAEGVITEILGEAGQVDVETVAVMRGFGLEEKFNKNCLKEARAAAKKFDSIDSDATKHSEREDITSLFTCTIDPDDSKDYDDAITIRKLGKQNEDSQEAGEGAYELGVHIADVSFFVEKGSALDEQAYQRGNSTYLPRRVVPMLPELLSNGVCSLQEGVKRFCKSCFIRFDENGAPLSWRFSNTIIKSDKRLTYREAQALIDNKKQEARKLAKTNTAHSEKLIAALKQMDKLARIIRKRREEDGMIELDLPEVELVFDSDGKVIDANPKDGSFTHTIIEMFMVEANEAAARVFNSLDVAMIRRIHPDPDSHSTKDLKYFAKVAGYNIPSNPGRKQLQDLLNSVRHKPAEHAVHLAVLKTLSKAEYSPLLIGHFALASEHYTHFTSPIRRYPDLIVHRGLAALIEAQKNKGAKWQKYSTRFQKSLSKQIAKTDNILSEDELVEKGRHCSFTERNSDSAEKNLRNFLVMQLLKEKLGEDFQGTVTGVTKKGVFVELDKFCIEGFVPSSKLGSKKDSWRLDSRGAALVSKKSRRTITIGHRLKARITNVDLPRRYMELAATK